MKKLRIALIASAFTFAMFTPAMSLQDAPKQEEKAGRQQKNDKQQKGDKTKSNSSKRKAEQPKAQ